jgi:hypothetical protein
MAQGDLFSRLVQTGGVLDDALNKSIINANQHSRAMEDLQNAQLNIYNTRKKMLKSDTDSLNVLKRMQSVHNKVYSQMKKNKELKEDILDTDDQIRKIELNIIKYRREGNQEMVKINTNIRNQLKLQNEVNKVQLVQMRKTIPLIGKLSGGGGVFADALLGAAGTIGTIFKVVGAIAGGIIKLGSILVKMLLTPLKKAFNIFLEMQSTVGNLAADIGLTAVESKALLNNFASLTLSAMKFGGSMKDVATVIQQFSQVTGKNRFFNEREIEQLVELGLGTGLGVDGASELAASFDNIGLSLEKTINLTDKARNMSAKMNLNVTKVLKTYQGLVQSLTGIGFGRGLDNLTKLAAKATAIRFDIVKSTQAFTDAFFEPEKAVEAAAKMQVLGGRFAQGFGDPMQLAFESMNEPEKLAEKVSELVRGAVVKSGNNFIVPPAERKMLRMAAETLGQDYNELLTTSIEQAKIADKMTSLAKSGFSLVNIKEEDRLGIANLMQMNEQGKYEIKMSDGTTKLLENITDKRQLTQIIEARKSNENAAIQRKNLMERLSLVVDRFMVGFSKVFDKLFGGTNFESFLEMVEQAGTRISEFIIKDLLGSNGLVDGFDNLVTKAKDIFLKVEKIFSGDGTFMQHVGQVLKLLFKDVAIPIISEVISFVTPILKAGIAELLHIIGGALPDIFGGGSLQKYAAKLRGESIASDKSGLLSGMYADSGAEIAAVGDKSANQGMSAISKMKGGAMGLNVAAHYGKKGIGKGLASLGGGMINKFGGGKLGQAGLKMGMFGEKMAAKTIAKRIPIIGSLVSFGLAIKDAVEGDWAGAGMQALSGSAGLLDLVVPGVGTAASLAIDTADAAREMGAFDDGVIYKDGSYAKFNKGDMVQFIDQAAMERAGTGGSGGGSSNSIQHSGVITIKSDDGKVVTWDQMYGARDLIGSRISSISDSYDKGFGNYQNPNRSPIQPLL